MRASTALRNAGSPLAWQPPTEGRCASADLGAGAEVRFSWLDQMAPAIAGGEFELIQAGPGNGGWLLSISLDDVEVQFGGYGARALTRGTVDAGRVSVLIPLRVRTPSVWEGCPSDPGALLVYAPGAQQFAVDHEGASWARVTVGAEHQGRAFFAATGRELELPGAGFRWLRPAAASLGRLKQRLRDLPRSIDPDAASRKPPRRRLEKQLLGELGRALGSAANASSHKARGLDPRRIVRAVEQHLELQIQEPVYLADLSAAAGVSERTVEYAFRRLLATTPMRYVKLLRLSRAHWMLRDSTPSATTVTRVALDWGFEHLSQFARDYRSVYGRSPSATLRGGGVRGREHDRHRRDAGHERRIEA